MSKTNQKQNRTQSTAFYVLEETYSIIRWPRISAARLVFGTDGCLRQQLELAADVESI